MTLKRYDPLQAPSPAEWLELDEGERLNPALTLSRRRVRGPKFVGGRVYIGAEPTEVDFEGSNPTEVDFRRPV